MRQSLLFICTILLLVTGIISACNEPTKKNAVMKDALSVIHNRKSVREYTEQPVTREQIDTLLRAGMSAPSAKNQQPWSFYVVSNRQVLDSLADKLPYGKMLRNAQVAIVVCGTNAPNAPTKEQGMMWVMDCSAASQNILLAAEAIGLGAVWTAAYPYPDRIQAVVDALKLPDNVTPLNVIPIGYPAGKEKPKDKYKEEKIHWLE